MTRAPAFRRTRWAAFFYEDAVLLDIGALFAGEVEAKRTSQVVAASVLTGEETKLSPAELRVLACLSSESWTSADDLGDDGEVARGLAERGLVVTNDDSGLRARDEQLTTEQWNRYGALFHFLNRRRGSDVVLTLEMAKTFASQATHALDEFTDQHGAPPAAFHRRDARRSFPLSAETRAGGLYETLRTRRTTRSFDEKPVSLADLSALLHYSFGCHGYWRYTDTLVALRKTSPSGGGLHPIEAYPIALNVDGVPVGAYHYNVERHALDLLAATGVDELRTSLTDAACGQEFFAAAGVIVVLTARFFRSFWKYRQDARAYAVLLMDAGHLSQTFQLVATELGLGTFVTAAIDGPAVDALISVDGTTESSLALCGCGRACPERSVLDADPLPYAAGRG